MVARETLVTVLSFQLRVPIVDLKHAEVDSDAVKLVNEDYAVEHEILPVGFDTDGSLRVATKMPNDFQLSSELTSMTGHQTKFVLALGGELNDLIPRGLRQRPIPSPLYSRAQCRPERPTRCGSDRRSRGAGHWRRAHGPRH